MALQMLAKGELIRSFQLRAVWACLDGTTFPPQPTRGQTPTWFLPPPQLPIPDSTPRGPLLAPTDAKKPTPHRARDRVEDKYHRVRTVLCYL